MFDRSLISDEKLKDLLLQKNAIEKDTLDQICEFAKNSDISLAEALVDKGAMSEDKLGDVVADFFGLQFIKPSKLSIPDKVLQIIPEKTAREYKAIPFARDSKEVRVAVVNPKDKLIQEIISKKTGQKTTPYLTTRKDFFFTLRLYRQDLKKVIKQLLAIKAPKGGTAKEDISVERVVDLIIIYAYQDGASDIHIEPKIEDSLIRFRIDGILHNVLHLPKSLHNQMVSRIKVLARLRTDEHLSPQDGQIRTTVEEDTVDIRISIVPIIEGEKVVLRLLSSKRYLSLADLGMSKVDLIKVNSAASKPFGMILSTGPTGSGKTTTIYAILKILNSPEKNITTIEDPVEYRIEGVNQIKVNRDTNLIFANGLRSILRQDPNIIFVGEIRDDPTASIAVNAALTGHLVLSTLHTNDAATALVRLIDMKVEPFLVASTVDLVIAQRLVRRVCQVCREPVAITREGLEKYFPGEIVAENMTKDQVADIFKSSGCKMCHYTGYKGRVGIFEVLSVGNKMRKLIEKKSDSELISKLAVQEGMIPMLSDGFRKILQGITTIEEILRATKIE